jgi:hypothetical protein
VKVDVLQRRGARRSWFGQRLIAVRRLLPAEGTFRLPDSLAISALAPDVGDDPFAPQGFPSLF